MDRLLSTDSICWINNAMMRMLNKMRNNSERQKVVFESNLVIVIKL